jgi:hypothetical protein
MPAGSESRGLLRPCPCVEGIRCRPERLVARANRHRPAEGCAGDRFRFLTGPGAHERIGDDAKKSCGGMAGRAIPPYGRTALVCDSVRVLV